MLSVLFVCHTHVHVQPKQPLGHLDDMGVPKGKSRHNAPADWNVLFGIKCSNHTTEKAYLRLIRFSFDNSYLQMVLFVL